MVRRPNIVYFVCHDLGRHLPHFGVPIATPHLLQFASEGVTFQRAFCTSTPCSPSRGCAMTGQYAHTNGLMGLVNKGWSMPRSVRTIVDELNGAGYETAHVGFQHERNREEYNRYAVQGPLDRRVERTVDHALAYLESRCNAKQPFYLNVGVQETHASMWAHDAWLNEGGARTRLYGIDAPEDVFVPPDFPDNRESRWMLGRFHGCIRFMDLHFGRFVAALDKLGFRDNTLIVFTTDHGVAGSRHKGTCYDRGLEIATFMRWPGVMAAGRLSDAPIGNIDFMPTLLEAAGEPVPAAIQGRSFWPLLTGEPYAENACVFAERNHHERYDPIRSARTRRYHYILNLDSTCGRYLLPHEILALDDPARRESWANGALAFDRPENRNLFLDRPAEELYDCETDPHEFCNVATLPEYSAVLSDLRGRCRRWMEETCDPALAGPIPDRLFPHDA